MSNPLTSTPSSRTPWGWLLFGFLLGAWGHLSLAEDLWFSWELVWFVVLLGAWLGGEYGWRALKPMLALGVFAILSIELQPSVAFGIGHGFGVSDYLLAFVACATFARNRDGLPASPWPLVRTWWRLALWLATFVLAVSVFADNNLEYGETVVWIWRPGALLALAILMTPVNWVNLVQRLRPHLSIPAAVILIISVVAALCVSVYRAPYEAESGVGFTVGLSSPHSWLLVLCFLSVAARLLDWRLLISVLLVAFIAAMLSSSVAEALSSWIPIPLREDPDSGSTIPTWYLLINSICAALLGVVLSPFWLTWEIAPMRTRRTVIFLGAVLLLNYAAIPLYGPPGDVSDDILILGGVAFIGALVWRGKGLLAFPLLLLMCIIVADPLANDSISGDLLARLLRVAMLIFPFALMGLLANRYERTSPAPTPVGALPARPVEVSP